MVGVGDTSGQGGKDTVLEVLVITARDSEGGGLLGSTLVLCSVSPWIFGGLGEAGCVG